MKKNIILAVFSVLFSLSCFAGGDYNPYKHDESFQYGLGSAWTNNLNNVFLLTLTGVNDFMVWRIGAEYTYHEPALSDYLMLGEIGKRDMMTQKIGFEYGVIGGFNVLRPTDMTPWIVGFFMGLDYNITKNFFAYATIQPYTYFKFGDTNHNIVFGNGLLGLTYLFG